MGDPTQNYINHIVLVLDESGSMHPHRSELVKVADAQIKHLADRSQHLDQETRVTIYTFSNTVRCIIYDKDVLRLPSIAQYYNPNGGTALIDATMQAVDDLAMTPEKYGDHAFLMYVLSDGEENSSRAFRAVHLAERLKRLPDHWTVAALVPNAIGMHDAKRVGFPAANVAIWSATSEHGIEEVGKTIKDATERFMVARASGVRGTHTLFATGEDKVNSTTIKAAGLKPVAPSKYDLIPVIHDEAIKDFVEGTCGLKFKLGRYYYQLMKTETIQPQKDVAILEVATGKIYNGKQARDLIGLPDVQVRAKPDPNKKYVTFVQSTAPNRKLIAGTKLLILT